MRVAFAGEPGAYSELAAKQYFGDNKKCVAYPEFKDVYNAVADGKCSYGILPIENSLAGSIHENYDRLIEGELHITGEIYLKISHYLVANSGVKKKAIRQVYSHPQALAQCKKFLQKMPDVELVPVSNTAGAVKMINRDKRTDAAAVASMQAAYDYSMDVLARQIEDIKTNQTRFIILGRKPLRVKSQKSAMKTSIVFCAKNIPGALFKALSVYALRDIDLYKIESRPAYGKNFEYMFYLDHAGYSEDEAQRKALGHLREITTFERVLGTYYVGRVAHPVYHKR